MISINIYNIIIGIFLVFLGFYILIIPPGKRVQKYFFCLCVLLTLWVFALGFRYLLSIEMREIVLNWILIPVLFIPTFLDIIVNSIFKSKYSFSKIRIALNVIFLPYLLYVALTGEAVKILDPLLFSYRPTLNYHLIISYSTFYISLSCISIIRSMIKDKGDERVRAFLLLLGVVIALFTTLLCVYIFPLLGLFYSNKLAFGFLPFSIIWAIAILHYDAFEIREHIIEEELSLPFLNRISSFPILKLFQILDPEEYCSRIILSKTNVVLKITSINSDLLNRENSKSLNNKDRAEVLARIFFQRIR
ncbi:LIC10906 family membrane protein [Leptospira alexanderi]|uniref:LIC10906 family membrane protein n=1 Tax=Leptospira alexanderi TaxID=100053 RepID=UPI000990EEDD